MRKIRNSLNLMRNMGWGYIKFRVKYELKRRSGLLRREFPVSPAYRQYISLDQWKKGKGIFFFGSRDSLSFKKQPVKKIEDSFQQLIHGNFLFFNSIYFNIGRDYNWITNPETGYQYDTNLHWTRIADYSKEAGDIKYVWEKSRFSYLYDVIRYDYHFGKDCAEFVFSEILDWIDHNPVNRGPNYRCSQETSLRVMNWTFALNYYRDSLFLTSEVFDKIQFSMYWQMDHIFKNIDFSRKAVRNNHAITETLALYLIGMLYPQFPESAQWKKKGKEWFEEEIIYQIYEDGTFLQFSMNYHRVVVQLLTWAIILSERNSESFVPEVYERAKKSVMFLRTCMIDENGFLPNYGANDGSLFFKLNDASYRDFRPALDALAVALHIDLEFGSPSEDRFWYGLESIDSMHWRPSTGIHSYNAGGYYIFREMDSLTFIRCGGYKDRPSQADNLHMDVWYRGENVLLDAGSYKYNTDEKTLRYFMGTASHNTVMLDDYDQMEKGPRFIWYNWSQKKDVCIEEGVNAYSFKGSIYAFGVLSKHILHQRELVKIKGSPMWFVKDTLFNKPPGVSVKQLWHLPVGRVEIEWESSNGNGREIEPKFADGFTSEFYGRKRASRMIFFESGGDIIKTEIKIINIAQAGDVIEYE